MREIKDKYWLALGLYTYAHDLHFRGNYSQARVVGEEALVLIREVGEPHAHVLILSALGYFAYAQGDLAMATQRYEQTLQIAKVTKNQPLIASCLVAQGAIAARLGQARQAARLWGAADGTALTLDLGNHNWYADIVRTQLGEEAFAAAWAEGQAMALEQILVPQELRET